MKYFEHIDGIIWIKTAEGFKNFGEVLLLSSITGKSREVLALTSVITIV